jgi:CHASE3 domain sensor protein
MHTRAARLVLVILFLSSIGTAAYLFWKGESTRGAHVADARSFDASVRRIERTVLDVRSSQRSYVAASHGGERWTTRVADGVQEARKSTAGLRQAAFSPQAQAGLDEVVSSLDDFARVDKRAVEYIRRNQPLLASDVIFADGQELTEAALTSLERARNIEIAARLDAADIAGRRGVFAISMGAAAAVLAVLLLLPGTAPTRASAPAGQQPSAVARPTPELRRIQIAGLASETWGPPRPLADHDHGLSASDAGLATAEEASSALTAIQAPSPAREPSTDFAGVATLCMDLARVVDTRAMPGLLDRTAVLLDASGIILWIADPDGRELNPIFAQGYPPQLINRLGTIPRDAENATAAAFRTSLLQTVMADDISAGAIAAPLLTSGGCVGVMAAEVRNASERQEMKLAAATIVAAQLATLVGPPARQARAGAV